MALLVNDVNIDHITINDGTPEVEYIVRVIVNDIQVWEKAKTYITSVGISLIPGGGWTITPNASYAIWRLLMVNCYISMTVYVTIMTQKISYTFHKKAFSEIGTAVQMYNGIQMSYWLQLRVVPGADSSQAQISLTPGMMSNGIFVPGQYEKIQDEVDKNNSEFEFITDNAMYISAP